MVEFVIDLNAKIILPDIKIWRIFPGAYYKFLPLFVNESLVFLDFPGLVLPDSPVTSAINDLKERIVVSKAVGSWIDEQHYYLTDTGVETKNPPGKPVRELKAHAEAVKYPGYGMDVAALSKLFGEAKKGDFVLVPDRGRSRRVYIGEFLDEPTVRHSVSLGDRYFGEQTPARRVRWFDAVDELRIPVEISTVLRTQNSLIQVPSQFIENILDVSYGTYVFNGYYSSRLHTRAAEFSGQDTLDIGLMAKLAATAASQYRHSGKLTLSISDLLSFSIPDEDQLSISVYINSPGFLNSKSETLAAIILGALLSLFAASDVNAKPEPRNVTVQNRYDSVDNQCGPDVSPLIHETLTGLGFKDYKALCEAAQRLERDPRLRSDSRTKVNK